MATKCKCDDGKPCVALATTPGGYCAYCVRMEPCDHARRQKNGTDPELRYSGDRKRYLGDGCYVDFDGYQFTLTTEDGISTTNTIVLEPEVYVALMNYVKECVGAKR